MKKIFGYLKKSRMMIILVVALLIVQAFSDLSLPDYTAKIINVGVQQSGVEHSALEAVSKETMNYLLLFTEDDEEILNSYSLISVNDSDYVDRYSYNKEEEIYVLTNDNLELVSSLMDKPLLIVSMLQTENEQTEAMMADFMATIPTELQDMPILDLFMLLDVHTLEATVNEINMTLDSMDEMIISQGAIAGVISEYEKLGVDMGSKQTSYIITSGLIMLGFALLSMTATILVSFIGVKIAAKLAQDLRRDTYKQTLSFSGTEVKKFGVSSLITRTTNDIQQVQMLTVFTMRMIIYAPILAVGGIIKAINTNVSMSWVVALAVIVIITIMATMFILAGPKFKKVQSLIDRLNQVTREIITGIPVIRAFSNQKHEEERFDKANTDLKKVNTFISRVMSVMMPTIMFAMNAVVILIVYESAQAIDIGEMQVGDMMAFIQYTMQVVMAFIMVSMFSIMFPRAAVSLGRIGEVLSTDSSIVNPSNAKTYSSRVKSSVEFKNVSFAYHDSDEDVLTDISFKAEAGKTTAFIGSTGSGKSTLVNLIPRLADASSGEVLVNGVNVKDVNLHDLHEKVGFVTQKGILFSGTIESNLKYGKPTISDDFMEKAASIAQATNFIDAKKDKYKSSISQGGTNVSGGQKQRLSIARALVTDPDILVFDDSFSALDFKTDATLRKELNKISSEKVVLIVAQRVATILSADQIVVLDEGKVVGIGTHKQLLNKCEVYKEIASSQLTKEELENA